MKGTSNAKWEKNIIFWRKKLIEGHWIGIERTRSSLSRYLLTVLNLLAVQETKLHTENIFAKSERHRNCEFWFMAYWCLEPTLSTLKWLFPFWTVLASCFCKIFSSVCPSHNKSKETNEVKTQIERKKETMRVCICIF